MKIKICTGKMCKERYSEYIIKRIKNDIDFHSLDWVILEESPCMWQCSKWPNVMFDKHLESWVSPLKASKILLDKKKNNKK